MVATPSWFLGTEIVFDLIFMSVAGIVTLIGFHAYRFFHDERHKLHSTGFLLLSASYLLLALTNIFLMLELSDFNYTVREVVEIANLVTIGSHLHALFFLAGIAFLLMVYLQIKEFAVRLLVFIIIMFGVLLSHSVQSAFYLLVAILLLFIIVKLYKNYCSKRTSASLLVLLGFVGVFFGEVLLSLLLVSPVMHVAAGIVTLLGYLLILAGQIRVLR